MYPDYFGLKEASFSITPDPQYLYLSRRHREALAHLLFGTEDSGGFVLLTGEVGTGKTTVCRAFLEQLPEHVDVALILNPALSAPELLHTVCGELDIPIPIGETSLKVLLDRLNDFLLTAHANGRRPVLLIDEAQNLKPEVLEQIRLLTNLETAKHKLLQIFLIGQPELRDLLERPELRQLAQRITARYHLAPLDRTETAEYIRHRLAVAGVERRLFTPAAVRRIFRLSGGVPRVINILCDRALLGGYATRRQIIDGAIVSQAARELRGEPVPSRARRWAWGLGIATLLLAPSLGLLAYYPEREALWAELSQRLAALAGTPEQPPAEVQAPSATPSDPPSESPRTPDPPAPGASPSPTPTPATTAAAPPAPRTAPPPVPAPTPATPPLPGLEELVMDARTAFAQLFKHWGLRLPDGDTEDPCRVAAREGLQCRTLRGTWNNLRYYNHPALIGLRKPPGTPGGGELGQALVTGLSLTRVSLESPKAVGQYDLTRVDPHWFGDILILWRTAPGNTSLVGPRSPPEAVRWLRQTLARVPGVRLASLDSGVFDQDVQRAVKQLQAQRDLATDGIAGPETLIQLAAVAGLPDSPRLVTP